MMVKAIKNKNGTMSSPPVHEWFGLSYTNYRVVPRMVLQEQSLDWQNRFIALMGEISDDLEKTPDYTVLRNDPKYTMSSRSDSEDDEPPIDAYYPVSPDPFANYRRGNLKDCS